jgi:hypothetical protein
LIARLLVMMAVAGAPEGSTLSLGDLPAYRAALSQPSAPAKVRSVTFADLWTRPVAYRDALVEVRGRVVRRFQQNAVGDFPALTEAWIMTAGENPIGLVFPSNAEARSRTSVGTEVTFSGTFLKLLRYQAGDGERLAPLVVGPAAPKALSSSGSSAAPWAKMGKHTDIIIGASGTALVGVVLLIQHLRKPVRSRADAGPPPSFLEESEHVDA